MDIVICYCTKCKTELGRFKNSWNGIGNTYHSPVYAPVALVGIEATGDVYNGATNSQIEHSLLQDLACQKCHTIIGLRCDRAPQGHLLEQDQLILRLTGMSVISEDTGEKAKVSMLKSYPLTLSSGKTTPARRAATAQPSRRISQSLARDVLRPAAAAIPAVRERLSMPPVVLSQPEHSKFKTWAEEAIKIQQKDIDRISGTVNRVERDMQALKAFMEEVRTEHASHKALPQGPSHEDMVTLRLELDTLRQQVEENGQAVFRQVERLDDGHHENEHHEDECPRNSPGVTVYDTVEANDQDGQSKVYVSIPASDESESRHSSENLSKRKHDQMINFTNPFVEEASEEPMPKCRRVTGNSQAESSSSVANKIDSPGPQLLLKRPVVEIMLSSRRVTLPVPYFDDDDDFRDDHGDDAPYVDEPAAETFSDDDDDEYHADHGDDAQSIQEVAAETAVPSNVLSSTGGNKQVPSNTKTPTSAPGASAPNRSTSEDLPTRSRSSGRGSQEVQLRDADGNLIKPNGRGIDKRSMRYKKLNPELQTPARSSVIPLDEETPARSSVIPDDNDEEKDTDANLEYTPSRAGKPCTDNRKRYAQEFPCDKCYRSYSAKEGLEYHKKYYHAVPGAAPLPSSIHCSTCDKDWKSKRAYFAHACLRTPNSKKSALLEKEVAARASALKEKERVLAEKEKALEARETLVRQTLEREMGH